MINRPLPHQTPEKSYTLLTRSQTTKVKSQTLLQTVLRKQSMTRFANVCTEGPKQQQQQNTSQTCPSSTITTLKLVKEAKPAARQGIESEV